MISTPEHSINREVALVTHIAPSTAAAESKKESVKQEKQINGRFFIRGWIYVRAGIVLETFNAEYTVNDQMYGKTTLGEIAYELHKKIAFLP